MNVLAPAPSRPALLVLPPSLRPAGPGQRDLAPAPAAAAPWVPGPAGGQSAAACAAAAYARARDAWPRPPLPVRDGCDLRV